MFAIQVHLLLEAAGLKNLVIVLTWMGKSVDSFMPFAIAARLLTTGINFVVLLSGWVKTVEAFRHAVAYLVEQKMWLAMRPPSGVDWACLSLCGLCIVCALVVCRLYRKRESLCAAVGSSSAACSSLADSALASGLGKAEPSKAGFKDLARLPQG
ncbi:TPA: hypothetical protein ACH3X1_004156 [Trebouxia sp. C0004]